MPTIINGTTGIDRVQPGVIVAEDIAANAVTTTKILDANITTAKILDANVTAAKLETLVTPLGVGQTWQAPARSAATDYTNSTGRPILVAITINHTGGGGSTQFLINSVTIANTLGASTTRHTQTYIIPNGAVYRVNVSGDSINSWAELR